MGTPKLHVPKIKAKLPRLKAPKTRTPRIRTPRVRAQSSSKVIALKGFFANMLEPFQITAVAPERAGKSASGGKTRTREQIPPRASKEVRSKKKGKVEEPKKVKKAKTKPKCKAGKGKSKKDPYFHPIQWSRDYDRDYKAAIKAERTTITKQGKTYTHGNLKGRKITHDMVMAINNLIQPDGEWGGGIDWEYDTHLPERIHATRGGIEETHSGKPGTVSSPSDESFNYELQFHTHPASGHWQGYNDTPSKGDLAGVTLYTPKLIATRNRSGKAVHILVTSVNKDNKDASHFDNALKASMTKLVEIEPGKFREEINTTRYRMELNMLGYDFHKIDPHKDKVFVPVDKATKWRWSILTRKPARNLDSSAKLPLVDDPADDSSTVLPYGEKLSDYKKRGGKFSWGRYS